MVLCFSNRSVEQHQKQSDRVHHRLHSSGAGRIAEQLDAGETARLRGWSPGFACPRPAGRSDGPPTVSVNVVAPPGTYTTWTFQIEATNVCPSRAACSARSPGCALATRCLHDVARAGVGRAASARTSPSPKSIVDGLRPRAAIRLHGDAARLRTHPPVLHLKCFTAVRRSRSSSELYAADEQVLRELQDGSTRSLAAAPGDLDHRGQADA